MIWTGPGAIYRQRVHQWNKEPPTSGGRWSHTPRRIKARRIKPTLNTKTQPSCRRRRMGLRRVAHVECNFPGKICSKNKNKLCGRFSHLALWHCQDRVQPHSAHGCLFLWGLVRSREQFYGQIAYAKLICWFVVGKPNRGHPFEYGKAVRGIEKKEKSE